MSSRIGVEVIDCAPTKRNAWRADGTVPTRDRRRVIKARAGSCRNHDRLRTRAERCAGDLLGPIALFTVYVLKDI
jgi:hypothetical protein